MATGAIPTKPIEPRPEFAGILNDRELFSTGSSDDVSERLNGWFDRLMIQSAMGISPTALLALCLLSSVALGGLAFVIQENMLTAAMAAVAGFMIPPGIAMGVRIRRQTQMMKQMPAMIDELARAAKTGRSLEQCFHLVAEETPDPLGHELRIGARRMQMGVDLGTALREIPERTGLVTLNILVTALTVHHQMGGDLVSVLERLSRTIRDRLLFLGRLRAATIASRATAILMLSAPPAILAFFIVRDPEYFTKLTSSSWGRGATMLAVMLDVIGSLWVLRILKNSQRT